MKKLLLLFFLVAVGSQVFGQALGNPVIVFYSHSSVSVDCTTDPKVSLDWKAHATWQRGIFHGAEEAELTNIDDPAQVTKEGPANGYPGEISGVAGASNPQIVVIRSGHEVDISNVLQYNGYIIVEPGAILSFDKVNGNIARLVMDASSAIDLRWADGNPCKPGDISAGSKFDQGLASDRLTIGGEAINGKWINTLPSPLQGLVADIVISNELLGCMKKDFKFDHVWTVEDLKKLLGCAGQVVPQPVELTTYSARTAGAVVELNWESAREWDFSHYVVEWSTDAQNFFVAATIEGKGTDQGSQRYSFRHTPGTSGVLYYRLLTVDIDGTVEDKGTKMVRLGAEIFNVRTANGRVLINYNGPADSKVVMFDTSGRIVRMQELSAEGIETSGISPGMYLLQISNVLEKKVTRVVVQ